MEQLNMELIVDARRLYQKNPKLFKETVEIIKRFSPTMPSLCRTADDILEIARGAWNTNADQQKQ